MDTKQAKFDQLSVTVCSEPTNRGWLTSLVPCG